MDKNIANYYDTATVLPIILGAIIIDFVFITLSRYFPEYFGQVINKWYNVFNLGAFLCDIGVIILGIFLARYIYTKMGWSWSVWKFVLLLLAIQLIHDVMLNVFIIRPFKVGHNAMIDMFKEYVFNHAWKILVVDAIMVIGSAFVASYLSQIKPINQYTIGIFVMYVAVYLIYKDVAYLKK
jgi:hypothetical protein